MTHVNTSKLIEVHMPDFNQCIAPIKKQTLAE